MQNQEGLGFFPTSKICPASRRARTGRFTERVLLSYACSETYFSLTAQLMADFHSSKQQSYPHRKAFSVQSVKFSLRRQDCYAGGLSDKGLLLSAHNNCNFAIIRLSAQGKVPNNSNRCSLRVNSSGHGADNHVKSVNAKPYIPCEDIILILPFIIFL